MAAFSFYQQPNNFVFDSFLVPYTSNKMPSVAELEPEEGSTTITAPTPANECSHQEIPFHAQFLESKYGPLHNIEMAMPIVDHHHHQITQMVTSNEEKKRKNMDTKKGEGKERKYNGVVRKQHLKKQRKKVAEEASSSGYVHVRARRGQATDSHSLAERVRRAKISVRMKLLQSLVPGSDTIKGKALILDEIIKYVQTLQTQVEFLAAKLASVSPMFNDFEVDFIANPLAQQCNNDWLWGNDHGDQSQELANNYQSEFSKFNSLI